MNYADIKHIDVANGPGVRVSLFVSGCSHRCPECFNPETWDFDYGQPFTQETVDDILKALEPAYIKGLTLLGGDPMERSNQAALLPLLEQMKQRYPEKTVWCFTGYLWEDLVDGHMKDWPETRAMLPYLDVIVDGPFVLALKNLSLRFKGSSNQRTILVQESLAAGRPILWDDQAE